MKNLLFWMAGVALPALVVAAVLAIVLVRKERAKCAALKQELAKAEHLIRKKSDAENRYRNRIHSLLKDLRDSRTEAENARAGYLFMLRNGYRRMGTLYEMRQFAGTMRESGAVLCQRVDDYLKEINGDPDGFKTLVKYLDESLGGAVSDLKEDIPDLGEEDIRLFCYLVVGFDAPLISSLMGIDNMNTVYSRRNRLQGKIKRLHADKARRYLALVA
jgi:hypothetical protein